MAKRKTHEEFVTEVYNLVSEEYTVLGEYKNNRTKILVRHNECGTEYEVTPDKILVGRGCPMCARKIRAEKQTKTHEQFLSEVEALVGDEYAILGTYEKSSIKISMRHNECGFEFSMLPSNFLKGQRCPQCAGNMPLIREEIESRIYDLVGDEFSLIGDYKGTKHDVIIRHNECGREFKVTPSNFFVGYRCPYCKKVKTTENFKQEVCNLVGDEYVVLGEYKNSRIKIQMRHKTCGFEYTVAPDNFLRGGRCPKCSGRIKKTHKQFVSEVHDLVSNEYSVLGEYKNSQTKTLVRHNKCGYEYMVAPGNFLSGNRCPKCNGVTKKTHKQFVSESEALIGNEYSILGEYKNSNTKILVRHNTCGFEYDVTPSHFLGGRRCPKCAGKNKTTESYKQEVYDLVGDEYTVLGEYVKAATKTLMRHNTCGHEYSVRPNSFLQGARCPVCQLKAQGRKRAKTHEQFIEEVKALVGDEYTVLGKYKAAISKITMKHNTCGCTYEVTPHSFLRGTRCRPCGIESIKKKQTKTHEHFASEVKALAGDEYSVIGEYKNAATKILLRHNECEREYSVVPQSFLNGTRCPYCAGKNKTTESFKQEVYNLVGDEYTVLGEYRTSKTNLNMRHNTCGYEYETNPDKFLGGRRCPHCSRSHGELAIEKILRDNGIKYKPEFRFPRSRYRYDFAVFDRTEDDNSNPIILIEFDGQQHFQPVKAWGGKKTLEKIQKRDRAKNRLAERYDIPLLRIRYNQFDLYNRKDLERMGDFIISSLPLK